MSTSERNNAKEHMGRVQEHGKNCRCKETADMKPRELLKQMVSDLAFWKKKKK